MVIKTVVSCGLRGGEDETAGEGDGSNSFYWMLFILFLSQMNGFPFL